MDKELGERMLAKGVAESMLRAGGNLPAKANHASLWAFIICTAGFVTLIGVTAAIMGVGQ